MTESFVDSFKTELITDRARSIHEQAGARETRRWSRTRRAACSPLVCAKLIADHRIGPVTGGNECDYGRRDRRPRAGL
jgi:hypothetical protein